MTSTKNVGMAPRLHYPGMKSRLQVVKSSSGSSIQGKLVMYLGIAAAASRSPASTRGRFPCQLHQGAGAARRREHARDG